MNLKQTPLKSRAAYNETDQSPSPSKRMRAPGMAALTGQGSQHCKMVSQPQSRLGKNSLGKTGLTVAKTRTQTAGKLPN